MLVITRREGEEVVIGDPENPLGVVRIASIKGDRVRIAFEFPREVSVHRREVAEQIKTGGMENVPGGSAVASTSSANGTGAENGRAAEASASAARGRATAGRHADASSRSH